MAIKGGFLAILAVFFICTPFVLATHVEGHTGNDSGQGGGLPSVVDRVALVEDVLNVQRLERYVGPNLFVGATEYQPGDPGKVFVQLTQEGSPLENSTCFGSLWYPNTTRFFFQQMMAGQEEGIYYHDFTVPDTLGVYPLSIDCQFFVSTIAFDAVEATDLFGTVSGVPFDIHAIDGLTLTDTEVLGNSRVMGLNITFTNTSLTNNSQFIFVDTFWRRIQGVTNDPPGDFINYYIYNYTNQSYVQMAVLTDYTAGFRRDIVTLFNISDEFVGADSTVQFLVNDSLGSPTDKRDTLYELDFFQLNVVSGVQNQTLENVRGGGEVHVVNLTDTFYKFGGNTTAIFVDLERIEMDDVSFLLIIWFLLIITVVAFKSKLYGYSVATFNLLSGFSLWSSFGWEIVLIGVLSSIGITVWVTVEDFSRRNPEQE